MINRITGSRHDSISTPIHRSPPTLWAFLHNPGLPAWLVCSQHWVGTSVWVQFVSTHGLHKIQNSATFEPATSYYMVGSNIAEFCADGNFKGSKAEPPSIDLPHRVARFGWPITNGVMLWNMNKTNSSIYTVHPFRRQHLVIEMTETGSFGSVELLVSTEAYHVNIF